MRQLGIITNNQHAVFQRNVLAGACAAAAQRGYEVVIDSYAEEPAHPQPITLDYRNMAGVLVIANAAPVELLRVILAAGKPISLVSHQVPDLPIPAVFADNTEGIVTLVKHVVENCHRQKLVYISGIDGQRDSMEREAAFRQQMMRYNLPASHVIRGDFSPAIAARALDQIIQQGVNFDAVIAADYLMGEAAVHTLRRAGVAVPQQVSVVGFGDAPEAELSGLTTVAADVVEQGKRACRQLISQIEGLRITGVTILSVRLIVRETCGCVLQSI